MMHSGQANRARLGPHRMESHMDSLKELKRQLTIVKAERAMLIRRGQSIAEIDATIVTIKAEIAVTGATVAETNAAGRFEPEGEQQTFGKLDVRDDDLMDTIASKNWSMQYPWRR